MINAEAHHCGGDRAHRDVAEHRRSGRSRRKSALLKRVIDPAVRGAGETFLSNFVSIYGLRDGQTGRKEACARWTRRSAAILVN